MFKKKEATRVLYLPIFKQQGNVDFRFGEKMYESEKDAANFVGKLAQDIGKTVEYALMPMMVKTATYVPVQPAAKKAKRK